MCRVFKLRKQNPRTTFNPDLCSIISHYQVLRTYSKYLHFTSWKRSSLSPSRRGIDSTMGRHRTRLVTFSWRCFRFPQWDRCDAWHCLFELLPTTLSKKYIHSTALLLSYRTSCTHFGSFHIQQCACCGSIRVPCVSIRVYPVHHVRLSLVFSSVLSNRSGPSLFWYILCNGTFNSITRFSSRLVLICAFVDAWDRDQSQRCHAILESQVAHFSCYSNINTRTPTLQHRYSDESVTPKHQERIVAHWN